MVNKKETLKKITVSILIISLGISSGAGLLYPKKTQAMVPTFDTTLIWETVAGWVLDAAEWAVKHAFDIAKFVWEQRNVALDIAMTIFRDFLLDQMINEIITWIQGGGKPLFVSDWKAFLKNAGDIAGGQVLEEIIGTEVMNALCQPNWAIKINIALAAPETFRQKTRCSLSDIDVNFDNFMRNFQYGGWAALFRMTESRNNPYGAYLNILGEKIDLAEKAKEAAKSRAESGGGLLSDRVCKQQVCPGGETYNGTWREEELGAECGCTQWETRTPGKIVADALSKSIFKNMEWVKNNEKWESYIIAITNALINRLIRGGIGALTSSDIGDSGGVSAVDQSGMLDTTPAVSTASVFDAWHIQITANEDVFIYYTLDGSDPSTSSIIYKGPIEIKTPTTLKWFTMDHDGNKEGMHTMSLYPPFATDEEPPSGTIMAVGSNSVSLIADKPAVIYYTLDGTTPTTGSERYIKKIQTTIPILIKWFGVSSQGVSEEDIHEIVVTPPLPNARFPEIIDLTEPVADISGPSSAIEDEYFALDASDSQDNDATPKIVMYEWDFDNDGTYDWWTTDWNRDGVFDESQYKSDYSSYNPYTGEEEINVGNGFLGMIPAGLSNPEAIEVKYRSGYRTITLRVTDDEGLYNTTTITINVQ